MRKSKGCLNKVLKGHLVIIAFLFAVLIQSGAHAFVIDVVDDNGQPITTGFRYLIEEDNTFDTIPGVGTPTANWDPTPGALNPTHTLAVNIHRSHSPVVCSGDTGAVGGAASVNLSVNSPATAGCFDPVTHLSLIDTTTNPVTGRPNKRYMVSVLPWHANPSYPLNGSTTATSSSSNHATPPWFSDQAGFGMSGHTVGGNEASVTMTVHKFPIPTAQITVLVFQDNQPINGALDQPAESGLPRFDLLVSDPISKVMQDAWGNPLGTTYKVKRSGTCTTVLPYFPGNSFCPPMKSPVDGTYQFLDSNGNVLPNNTGNGFPAVDYMGNGTLTSCPSGNAAYDTANCTDLDTGVPLANGEAVIRFLNPNRYVVEPIPPANDPDWILTATFEGTRGNDNWVRATEPRFNIILGQLNWLAPFGFVKKCDAFNGKPCAPFTETIPPGPKGTIKGQVVYAHDMHPPFAPGLSPGVPVPNCYVGLNNLSASDEEVYTQPCNPDSTFQINNVPPGLYQVVMWDWPINAIMDFRNITIPPTGGTIDLGETPIYGWFGTMMGSVFFDTNKNGIRDPGYPPYTEPGIPQMRVNARNSDGSLYASQLTDANGNYQFSQYFPWWRWLVMELDPGAIGPFGYSELRTTGMTAVIDDGSYVNASDVIPGVNPNPPPNPNHYAQFGINPQLQPNGQRFFTDLSGPDAAGLYTEVSTEAMMLLSDMTNIIDWGKQNYDAPNPDGSCPAGKICNGGIRGFISYATSRTQENPQWAAVQSWEPGIPRVQVNLNQAVQAYPSNPPPYTASTTWSTTPNANTPQAVCATCSNPNNPNTCTPNATNPTTGLPNCTTPINITYTDSFDDNNPTGCVSTNSQFWPNPQRVGMVPTQLHTIRDCAETFRTWDQVRPGAFDGTYAFTGYCNGTVTANYNMVATPTNPVGPVITCGGTWVPNVPQGNYIVEAVPPNGYKILKWGDRNIEFGEPSIPFQAATPPCVGPQYNVPAFHALFVDWQIQTPYPSLNQWYCDGQYLWNSDGSLNTSFSAALNPDSTCKDGNGPTAPLCTMKMTQVANNQNSIVDFRMFTDVPKSSRIWGWVSDDLHLESNPYSPNASSNFAPSWLPVSIQDWHGNEVGRFYTDQWGKFNGLIPSTYTIFPPDPLGMSAGIYTIFPNDLGPVLASTTSPGQVPERCPANPASGQCVPDPWYNPGLGRETIRENWDFYAGKTTFVDTIVIPTTGFVANRIPLNCDYADKTPSIDSVYSNWGISSKPKPGIPSVTGHGPVVPATGGPWTVTINAINYQGAAPGVGLVEIPNPDYNPSLPISAANPQYVTRDHGFGTTRGSGSVAIIPPTGARIALPITSWNQGIITAKVPTTVPAGDYQLVVTRGGTFSPGGGPISSVVGVTFHVVSPTAYVDYVQAPQNDPNGIPICNPYIDQNFCMRIQPAIDFAANDSTSSYPKLIIVGPGNYMENPIMYAPVQLQGVGGATVLDNTYAIGNLPMKNYWVTLFANLQGNGWISLVPGSLTDFTFEQGAGLMVASCDYTTPGSCPNGNAFTEKAAPMIDGMVHTEASEAGGGIYGVGFSPHLQISNCEIIGNQGSLSGGIRVGNGDVINGTVYTNSHNENMTIAHNRIAMNGSLQSGGGGISLYKGSDNYLITNNLICGNFSIQYGGGIDHFGLSPNGVIAENVIVSNESFDQGGGIMIAGELPIAGAPSLLTEGSGSVTVNANLIQGNKGGDDGGGVSLLNVNGQDIAANPNNQSLWYTIELFNNMIVNNSSGDHGGAISIDDAVLVNIINDTIANNDSTSTGSGAFGGPCVEPTEQVVPGACPSPGEAIGGLVNSLPRVGGIATFAYSTDLAAVLPAGMGTFCNPVLVNDILWQNRTFYWDATWCSGLGGLRPDVQGLCTGGGFGQPGAPEAPFYWDLQIYNAAGYMSPTYSDFSPTTTGGTTQATVGTGDINVHPRFVKPYLNIYQATSKGAAFGNFVQVTLIPNGLVNSRGKLYGNYHLHANSPAVNKGTASNQVQFPELGHDYDGQIRPRGPSPDIGADERYPTEIWFPWNN